MDFLKKASASLQEGNTSDLFKQAQSFMGESDTTPETAANDSPPAPGGAAPAATEEVSQGGYGEVYGNAQILYQGIQDKLSGKSDVDNKQLAGAADDLLKAADSSGFLKDSQYKDYFTKADGYLSSYASQGAATETEPTTLPTAEPTSTPSDAPQDQD